jgi:DNA-binding transcriptional ArsR family regulator
LKERPQLGHFQLVGRAPPVATRVATVFSFLVAPISPSAVGTESVTRPDLNSLAFDGAEPILNYMVQCSARLDTAFTALSDQTRRGILERLGRGDASITELAQKFEMTLTGIKKHVQILEGAGLLTTEKVGRVRSCTLGPRRLAEETAWINGYQQMLEQRYDQLGEFLERTKGKEP